MSINPRIIIVGAGAAGIAAASHLIEKGFQNILILEAKNRIGGRIHTIPFSENLIELGAQWCHGEKNNIVYKLASPYNLLESSKHLNNLFSYIFINSNGDVISEQETAELWKLYYKIVDEKNCVTHKPGTTFGDYFTKQFYKETKKNSLINKDRLEQVLAWMHKYHNSIECCDSWYDVSARMLQDYYVCEGDALLNWKTNGYSKIFDLLTRNYPDTKRQLSVYEKILYNKEVLHIDYTSGNDIKVKTSDGLIYNASNLIFTASLGVLKEQYLKLFTPILPEPKVQAIKGFNIGVANKIFLEFPYRWWPQNSGGLCLLWSKTDEKKFLESHKKDKHWLCDVSIFFTVDNQPRLLNGWIVGPNAKYIEELSDDKVLNDLYYLLQRFFSHIYDIPKPQAIRRSKWFSDKHVRGSYSYRSMQTEMLNIRSKDIFDPIKGYNNKPLILFAGEATHEHYFSTVHGAIETGFREADRIIEYYRCIQPRL